MFLAFFCISICDGYQTVVPHHQIRRPLSLAGRDSYATCSETQHLYLNATLIIIESLDIAQHPTTNDICAEFGQAPLHRTRNGSSLDVLSGCWHISQPNWTCREWWVTVESLHSHFQIFERTYTENGNFMGITCTYELETSSTHYTLYVFYW